MLTPLLTPFDTRGPFSARGFGNFPVFEPGTSSAGVSPAGAPVTRANLPYFLTRKSEPAGHRRHLLRARLSSPHLPGVSSQRNRILSCAKTSTPTSIPTSFFSSPWGATLSPGILFRSAGSCYCLELVSEVCFIPQTSFLVCECPPYEGQIQPDSVSTSSHRHL